jgi:hypothetical protein
MLQGARDAIPNVRFTAARALQEMAPYIDETTLQGQVSNMLSHTLLLIVLHSYAITVHSA